MNSRSRQRQNRVRRACGRSFLAADEERGFHQIEAEVLHPALRQRPHDVRLVEIAVAHPHRIEALAEFGDFEPPLVADMRHVLGLDLHQDDPLVQHLVVLHRVQQRDRHMRRDRAS